MIRIQEEDSWLLLEHAEHAALAGEFARHWKNQQFEPPEPFAHILDAVSRHDDSWRALDARPSLTPDRKPSAFSRELVGTYDAFEEIDLEGYLEVRARATEIAAQRDPYAAVLISMHTVNLLTEQADLSGLNEEETEIHRTFIQNQRNRQEELISKMKEANWPSPWLRPETLNHAFEFLQACDSLSLFVGVNFDQAGTLRHRHPGRDGRMHTIRLSPLGAGVFTLDPYPLDEPELQFRIPYRRVPDSATVDLDTFREAYSEAPIEYHPLKLQSAET